MNKLQKIGIGYLIVSTLPSIAFAGVSKYDDEIYTNAKAFKLDYFVIKGIIATESSFLSDARASSTSARGLMQMTKGAAQTVGVNWSDLDNPDIAIYAGCKYLRWCLNYLDTNNIYLGLKAYYGGVGTATDGQETQLDKDSREYAAKVLLFTAAFAASPYELAKRLGYMLQKS